MTNKPNLKQLSIWSLMTFFFIGVNGQILEPTFSIGYGSYAMNDLKKFNDYLIGQIPFPVRITDDFPMYLNYEMGVMVPLAKGKHKVGFALGKMSTGSRANVSDYSGSYTADQLVKGTKLGINYEGVISEFSVFQFAFNANVSYLETAYHLEESFVIGNQNRAEEIIELESSGFCFEPRLKLSMPVKRLVISFQAGYLIDSAPALHLRDDKDLELQLDGESIGADFSGVRFNTAIAFKIG